MLPGTHTGAPFAAALMPPISPDTPRPFRMVTLTMVGRARLTQESGLKAEVCPENGGNGRQVQPARNGAARKAGHFENSSARCCLSLRIGR